MKIAYSLIESLEIRYRRFLEDALELASNAAMAWSAHPNNPCQGAHPRHKILLFRGVGVRSVSLTLNPYWLKLVCGGLACLFHFEARVLEVLQTTKPEVVSLLLTEKQLLRDDFHHVQVFGLTRPKQVVYMSR